MANGITSVNPTPGQLARIRQQQARAATYGNYNYTPNVAALTMEDVARRNLVPTRTLAWSIGDAVTPPLLPTTDILAAILAQIAPTGFPQPFWDLQQPGDRQEIFGDTIVGCCVTIQATVQCIDGVAGNIVDVSTFEDNLEQMLYQALSLSMFPTSGNLSPLVFQTELRAFGPRHNLAGADGFLATPAFPVGDQFASISLVASAPPVAIDGNGVPFALPIPYQLFTQAAAVGSTWSTQGTISCQLKKIRGTA